METTIGVRVIFDQGETVNHLPKILSQVAQIFINSRNLNEGTHAYGNDSFSRVIVKFHNQLYFTNNTKKKMSRKSCVLYAGCLLC